MWMFWMGVFGFLPGNFKWAWLSFFWDPCMQTLELLNVVFVVAIE